jgi:DNA-binding CsgD family transcriptional regulator
LDEKIQRTQGNTLIKLIDHNLSDDDQWEQFQNNFDLIHENFFMKLKEKYPALTPSDLRLSALLRLNYSSKEIARMLNLTPRGVEAARYRLRKKLALDSDKNLVDFMINFK